MIWWALTASGVAVLAGLLAVRAMRNARRERKRANGYAREIDKLTHVIQRMEEVNREANARKDQMATGSVADRVDATVDVLSDIAKGRAKHRP